MQQSVHPIDVIVKRFGAMVGWGGTIREEMIMNNEKLLSFLKEAYVKIDTNLQKNFVRQEVLREIHQTYHYLSKKERGSTAIRGSISQMLSTVNGLQALHKEKLSLEELELLQSLARMIREDASDIGNTFMALWGM